MRLPVNQQSEILNQKSFVESQIEQFIEYLATQKHYAGNTLMAYRNDLLQFHQFVLNARPFTSSWARVDTLLLQAFLLDLKARNYSAASIARTCSELMPLTQALIQLSSIFFLL